MYENPGRSTAPLPPAVDAHEQGCGLARKGHGNAAIFLVLIILTII